MKKILLILLIFTCLKSYSQDTIVSRLAPNNDGKCCKIVNDTIRFTPNISGYWFNGYGNFIRANTDSIQEGSTNLFFTNARARSAISLTTTGSGAATYNSTTGVLNIPTPASVSGAALTKTDDANVTLTLGGTPSTALLQATSLTLGWTGTLSNTRGGTGTGTYTTGDILYASASNTLSKLPIGTSRQKLGIVGGIPTWIDSTASGGSGWSTTGNSGLTAGTNFLGNTDYVPLEFRVKNRRSGYIDSSSTITGMTLFGYAAGIANTSLTSTFIGFFSGKNNTSGTNNTALGNLALLSNITGADVTAIGSGAAKNVTASSGTYIGAYSGELTVGASSVVGVGKYTLRQNTGIDNTAVGYSALAGSASGGQNTAVGKEALGIVAVAGSDNTGVGNKSLTSTTSSNNIGLGSHSGQYNTSATGQVFIGGIDRSSYTREQARSIFYGQQSALSLLTQYATLNGKVGINTVTPTSFLQLTRGTAVANTAPAKFTGDAATLTTTGASGTGSVATLTFASTTVPPYVLGSTIVVSGVTPSGYNGTFSVSDVTETSVSYTSTTTGSQTVAGTITQVASLLATPEAGAVEYAPSLSSGTMRVYVTGADGVRGMVSLTFTGTAAPATTPSAVGDHYIDTTNKKEYVATGTSSSADWTILN